MLEAMTTTAEQSAVSAEQRPILGGSTITNASTSSQSKLSQAGATNDRKSSTKAPKEQIDVENRTTSKPAAASTTVDDPAHLKSTDKNKTSRNTLVSMLIGGVLVTLITLLILSVIPILKLIIGWRYQDKCPANPRIPQYLVVAGITGLLVIILLLIQVCLGLYLGWKTANADLRRTTATAACALCGTLVGVFILFFFLFVWFIVGCVWIFGAWNKIQYTNPKKSDYCHPTLYRFAFWLLLLSVLYQLFSCYRACFQTREQMTEKKKGPAIPVPTSEP